MRGLEARLRRLEGRGSCPLCEESRAAVLEHHRSRAGDRFEALRRMRAGCSPYSLRYRQAPQTGGGRGA